MAESTSCGGFSGARENVAAPELNPRGLNLSKEIRQFACKRNISCLTILCMAKVDQRLGIV